MDRPVSRRQLLTLGPLLAALTPLACRRERRSAPGPATGPGTGQAGPEAGRLSARPPGTTPAGSEGSVGLQPLGLARGRDGFVYIPSGYQPDRPHPLVVMLHGAGGDSLGGLSPLRDRADEAGMILLAPDSRDRTWDALLGGFGPDVRFLDRALAQTYERYTVAPGSVAVEGFSDGASYALGLGLANGDLFRGVVAFSPGFVPPAPDNGAADIFISHGVADDVLPIDRCSRRIVPRLRSMGYDVRYVEFEGGHAIPPDIVDEALVWWRETA